MMMMVTKIEYTNDVWLAESYLRYGNSLKLTYLILCGKALVYAVLVSGLVWTAKVSESAPERLGILPRQGSVDAG